MEGRSATADNGGEAMKRMIEAVLKNGVITPLESIPPEWSEGSALAVQFVVDPTRDAVLEHQDEELNGRDEQLTQEEWEQFQASLDRMHREAKETVRRQMGLP
jgi:hypothetical protein